MKKVKITLMSMIALGAVTSCQRYLDVNNDPNHVAVANLTPDQYLPVGITSNYYTQSRQLMQFASVTMNTDAGNSIVYGAPFIDEYKPNVSNTFYNTIWDGMFRATTNLAQVVNYNDPQGQYAKHKAIAMIMKANYVQILTDLYGDMPYSQAFQGQSNLTPKYDKGEDIYKASIADLENARKIIAAGGGNAPDAADIVFHGSMDKWSAFANTLELRYLLRMSNVTGDMATFRDQKLASLSGATFIDEDVLENPGYSSANDSQQNPFTNYFLYTTGGSNGSNYSINVASEHIAIILNGNSGNDPRDNYQKFNGIVDGRRGRMFKLIGGKVSGIRQGNLPGDTGVPSSASHYSYGITIGQGTPTSVQQYIDLASAKSGCIMSRAESKFLQAEAALRYPGLFSNDQGNFTDGIQASFNFFGATGAADYLSKIATVPGLGWTGTFNNKLDAIMTQKLIALTGVNPEQSYFDYTRTGYPFTPLPTIATNPKPNRLIYPLSEYIGNAANVPAVKNADVFTKNQYTPFWAR